VPAPLKPAAFPTPRPHGLEVRHEGFAGALALRCATEADLGALQSLYAATRAEELAAAPWAQATKAAFLGQQFALQHHHFVTHYPDADFLVIAAGPAVVGRFYRWRASASAEPDVVVDVSLLPAWRGQGLGEALLRAAMAQAAARSRGLALQVLHHNGGARRLYERLGFSIVGDSGAHLAMRWPRAA